MEIILVIVAVGIMVSVSFLKPRLPRRILVPLSLFIGLAMLICLWGFREGQLPARVLITVLVLSGFYTTFRTSRERSL